MSATLLSTRKVKIRKARRCFGCQRLHQPNTEMMVEAFAYDGRVYSEHNCSTCHTLLTKFYHKFGDDEDGVDYGCITEYIRSGNEIPTDGTPEQLLEALSK